MWASAFIWRGYVGWLTHAAAAGNSVVSVATIRRFAIFWTLRYVTVVNLPFSENICNFLLANNSHLSKPEAILRELHPLRHVWLLTSFLPRSWSSWLFCRAFICRWNLCWSEQSCSRYWQVLLLSVWNRCLIPSEVFWRQIFFFFRTKNETFKWKWGPAG